jgi:hypothetical protein
MHDFWGPFVFGMSWLALALVLVWLLRRSSQHRLALRNRAARVLAWMLVLLAASIFLLGLPFSLGLCRGGFDDPLTCAVVPLAVAEVTSPLSLVATIAGLLAVPALLALILALEVVNRWSRTATARADAQP